MNKFGLQDTKEFYNDKGNLLNACYFNPALRLIPYFAEYIIEEVNCRIKNRTEELYKQATECIIANLVTNHFMNNLTILPKSPNPYKILKDKYDEDWCVGNRIIAIANALNYMKQVKYILGNRVTKINTRYILHKNGSLYKMLNEHEEAPAYDYRIGAISRDI